MNMSAKIKAFGEVMMRLEVPNYLKLEQTRNLNVSYSGTGVNVLSALSRFGHQTSLITKLPANSVGDAAIANIRSLGISTDDIVRGGDYVGLYFLEKGFHVRSTKVTYSNRQESSFCTSTLKDFPIASILKNTNMIHFCGISLAISENIREMTIEIARQAKQLGITIIFDCNYRPKLWNNEYMIARQSYMEMVKLADICFMSKRDAQFLLGMEEDNEDSDLSKVEELLKIVADEYDIQTIACTIRKERENLIIQGFIYHDGATCLSKEYVYKTLDRIGAGDGFASGIIHGLIHHFPIDEMIEFSTAASVLAHTTYGDTPVCSAEEIWSLVHQDMVDIER